MFPDKLHEFGFDAGPTLEVELPALDDTRRLGRALAQTLPERGLFIGLIGNLGAGKTTLVQALLESIAPGAEARSPTYTLLNHYQTQPPLIHIDLYRLDSADELETMGYWDYIESEGVLSCVEWIDRIPQGWPGRGILLQLERRGEERVARLWAAGQAAQAVVEKVEQALIY